ncbi:hypothetical protein [Flexivirga sp. B27]
MTAFRSISHSGKAFGAVAAVVHQPDRACREHHRGCHATLTTADNAPMTISYATASQPGGSQEHTGTQTRHYLCEQESSAACEISHAAPLFG